MTFKDPRLFHDVRTTKDFLLSQTEGAQKVAEPSCTKNIPSTDDRISALVDFFPKAPVKNQLIDLATPTLEPIDKFIALVIKIDEVPVHEDAPEDLTDSKAVVAALEALCQKESGIWGILAPSLFGCFIPEKTASFSDTASTHIRNHISKVTQKTVTIGNAVYPLADFPKTTILENACKAVEHAAFFGPNSTVTFDDVSLNISGDNLFQHGDIQAAIKEFLTALSLNDGNTNVRNSLGVCYGLLGQYDDAIESFTAATVTDPEEFMAFYNLGLVYMIKEDYEKALKCFDKASQLSKDVFEISIQTGRMHLELGQPQKAKIIIEKAIELKPTSALGYRLLGDCLIELGKQSDAMSAYKQAIKLHPNDASALSALGAIYEAANRNIEIASLYCEKSVEIAPSEGLFHERLGKLYLKQNRLGKAAESFQRAGELGQNVQDFVAEIQHQKKAG